MVKRLAFLGIIVVFLFIQAAPLSPAAADPGGEFYAIPASAAPGAALVFTGFGFTPDSTVDLYLMTTPSEYLGALAVQSNGEFSGEIVLPQVAPGDYQVMISPNDVFAPLSVLPPLLLNFDPSSGPPGTPVSFSVDNLSAGQLRLDYAGVPVYGPVSVEGGSFFGEFIVPADRPEPLGADAEVRAVNLLGGQAVGAAAGFFVSQEPAGEGYAFQNVEMPSAPVAPGETFTITGQISPPPAIITPAALKALWKTAEGQVAPITLGTPVILADGSFTLQARAPSLLAGDPFVPQPGGQVGLVFYDPAAAQTTVSEYAWGVAPPDPVFIVKVVDTQGSPIQGALVDVRAFYSKVKSAGGETTTGEALSSQISDLAAHPNQVTAYLGPLDTSQSDPFTCEQTNVYGRTNAQGEFAVQFDPATIAMMGEKVFLGNLPQPKYAEVPVEITFPLYVNALHQGFGEVIAAQPTPYERQIRFSSANNRFYDAKTNQLLATNPIVVTLPPLPAGTNLTIPILPRPTTGAPLGGFKNYLGTGIPMSAFGKYYSFPLAQYPDAWFTPFSHKDLHLEFQHDQALFGALDEANLKFTLLGQTYPFVNMGLKYSGTPGCNAVVYRAVVPNFSRLPAGFHTGLIEIRDASVPVNVTRHYVQLNLVPAPGWILDAKYQERSIHIDAINGSVVIEGSQYPPGGEDSTSALDTDVPKVGAMENRAGYEDEVVEILYPDKTTGVQYRSQTNTTALDTAASPQKFGDTVAGGKVIAIGPKTLTILNTGKIPLFRDVFGIWPIASATIGADMWFDATLTLEGKVKFTFTGGTQTSMLVTPQATVGVDAWFDLSALFGVVSADAHAIPQITLKMPANFVDGSLEDSTKCFLYRLDIKWSAKVGVCPLCLKESDTENIFDGANPDPCTLPANGLASAAMTIAETPAPPVASPALAVDGYGHTLLLWSDESGNLQSQLLTGGKVVTSAQVTGGGASSDPAVAFYAPGKAVAVWTENSLTAGQSGSATLAQIVQAQHLKYALWDGVSWSAAQNLTLPADSSGEGGAALAGCLSTHPGCPAGGAATAVWTRDAHPSGDLNARQFRLTYATFNNGAWSAAAAVDPASAATDSEPSVAYQSSGVPLVAWVRDADRGLGTLSDRRIVYRSLSVGEPVIMDIALPAGAVEPSLAVNAQDEMRLAFTVATDPQTLIGNQRQLHAAQQTCGGDCTWAVQALVDANARPLHAESPILTLNAAGQAVITYRALGFGAEFPGGAKVLPGDALGTILGTGEMAQAIVDFTTAAVAPSYLTNAGKTVWQTAAAFDPLLNQVFAVSSQGGSPALPQHAVDMLAAQGYTLDAQASAGGPLAFVVAGALPDLSIYGVTTSSAYFSSTGEPFWAAVSLLNNGTSARSGFTLKLTWDGPAGLGAPAGEINLPALPSGLAVVEFSTEAATLTLPDLPHLPHTLYVQINPAQSVAESDYSNNLLTLGLGGLPAPQNLVAVAQANSSSVFLEWTPVEHEALGGYRVYRSADGREFEPVGGSLSAGFVDLSALAGVSYTYAVASYSYDGVESPLSETVLVEIGTLGPIYLPLLRR
ncbi:MAG: hypothetical protein L0Z70_05245 [Chloroflexi bacterium]|nr:hypothetical protein [Chloroflexota bacterium]